MRTRSTISGIEVVPTGDGIARLRYSSAKYREGDIVDLTLPIGSYGEEITTRRHKVVAARRSQYSGRLEYHLRDDESNRIDYTRWFEEEALSSHDFSVPDPMCKRITSKGRPCQATPTYPSGLCIKHKAKLDWDRERQRRKLEADLERRRQEQQARRPKFQDQDNTYDGVQRTCASTSSYESKDDVENAVDGSEDSKLADERDRNLSHQVSMSMWGEADLFARTAAHPIGSYLDHAPRYSTNDPLATPNFQIYYQQWRPFRTCLILIFFGIVTVVSSLSIALWWSIKHSDTSGGFTMGAYVVAVGSFVLLPTQYMHNKSCRCWGKLRRTPTI